jgi:hypothetical protein
MYTPSQHELLTQIIEHVVTVQHTEADLIQIAINCITEQYRALPMEMLVAIASDMQLDIITD